MRRSSQHPNPQLPHNHLRRTDAPIQIDGPNHSFHRRAHRPWRHKSRAFRTHGFGDIPRHSHAVARRGEGDVGGGLVAEGIKGDFWFAIDQYFCFSRRIYIRIFRALTQPRGRGERRKKRMITYPVSAPWDTSATRAANPGSGRRR